VDDREGPFGEGAPVDMVVGPGEADNKRFGELLERLRWKTGLSRSDAAAQLGFSGEYLRLIELGKRTPALGQMRKFLSVYGAKGGMELDPHGHRQDLILFDPINDDDRDPTFVEFKSRIREARRSMLGGPPGDEDDWDQSGGEQPTESRASELGLVVSLLTRADGRTLRRIRELLEEEVD
jgi:transcriptional regulator with XRE-family HTH domain